MFFGCRIIKLVGLVFWKIGFGTTYLHKMQCLVKPLHDLNPIVDWLDSLIGPNAKVSHCCWLVELFDWSIYYEWSSIFLESHFQIYGCGLGNVNK
jgi:hypothetical protein